MNPRVVFDCVVCLQGAARETGPAGACFRLMTEGAYCTVTVGEELRLETWAAALAVGAAADNAFVDRPRRELARGPGADVPCRLCRSAHLNAVR